MFRIVLLLALRLAAVRALQWSERFQDKSGPMEVCSGQHIRLFWNYTLNKGEKVKDMVWTCQPKGQKVAMMASFVDGHFVPESEFSGRLSHLTNGGIELSCATILESGNYTVAVRTVDNSGTETLHRQTAWVKVVATATLTVSFHAKLTSNFPGFGTLKPFTAITNEGQAFNGTSGVFTAPVNGLYVFLASAGTASSDKGVYMHLRKDGVDVSRAYTQQYSGYLTMGSVQATLRLTTGQQVLLHSSASGGYYYYPTTSFTGFLIHADE